MALEFWFLDWLTFTLAITWTLAGAILVLVGWLTLPRRSHGAGSKSSDTSASIVARVVGGSLLGTVATILAAYTLLQGGGWVHRGFESFDGILRFVIGTVTPYAGHAAGRLFELLSGWAAIALRYLTIGLYLAPQLPGLLASAWAADHGYALVDTTALALVAVVGGGSRGG